VLAKLRGVSPETVVGWQERTGLIVVVDVVEVVTGFDHGL